MKYLLSIFLISIFSISISKMFELNGPFKYKDQVIMSINVSENVDRCTKDLNVRFLSNKNESKNASLIDAFLTNNLELVETTYLIPCVSEEKIILSANNFQIWRLDHFHRVMNLNSKLMGIFKFLKINCLKKFENYFFYIS